MQAPGHSSLFPLARLLLFLCALLAGRAARAQEEDFHHPELTWKTIETAHFLVHYHEGAERTARVVAKVAEEIYEPVTSLYEHTPDQRVSLIIRDVDDIANGAAYFYDNKIELFAPSMDFELRGTHNWLRNVVAHEFTHIVQIQTAMKFGRTVPAFYLQWLNYESERRPDVLYGYPNVIASYPISGFVVPAWFAEGVAQYNRKELRYDFWDSHRDMILRSYALDGNLLSWDQMGVFGKTSLGNESSYNAGFAFVSYIARWYGEEKLLEISRNLSRLTETTIDGAIRRAVGKDGRELYDEWRQAITEEYRQRIAPVRAALREGTRLVFDSSAAVVDPSQIESNVTMHRVPWGGGGRPAGVQLPCCSFGAAVGFANLYPSYSPDGTKLAYTSTKGADYFSLSALYVYDFSSRKETLVQPGVRTALAWSPDGAKLYYAKNTRDNPHWSLQFDLYEYDLRAEKEKRITRGRRAMSPSVSPAGDRLVCVVSSDGTSNLALANVDGSDFHLLTHYEAGEQVYNPRWSPAGDQIVFDFSVKDGRDIALIRPDGSGLRYLLQGPEDTRSAVFTQDGKGIVYSSDRTGVFNLYYYELSSGGGGGRQLTNVTGGAFLPTVAGSGAVVYALYTSGGYKLFRLDSLGGEGLPSGSVEYERSDPPSPPAGGTAAASAGGGRFDWPSLRTYDDTELPLLTSTPYKPRFTSLGVVPFLRVDNYNARSRGIDLVKPGVYLFSNEILDKTGFFASASMNLRLERDLYLQFAYRGKLPLFYQLGLEPVATAELFNVTRKTQSTLSLPASTIPVDLTYDLMEFDFALRQPALSQFSAVELRYAHSRYASVIENFINPETTPPTLVSGSRELYLIANTFTLTFDHDAVIPSRTSEINPVGRKVMLRLSRELNKFNGDGEYEITSIGLQPKYKTVNFTRAELRWREHVALPFGGHTLTALLHGGAILGPEVDEFFDFYAGGLVGMRGYPFYALGGNRMAVAALHYRFPLVQNMDFRVLSIYFDKLYASVFADVGNAWSERRVPPLSVFKKDIGAELRLESFSFYAYPTRFFLSAAYGFDRFDRYISRQDQTVTYGREWRFYFGVLFGFDLD